MRRSILALTVAVSAGIAATAHELPESSATVIVRDGGQVELRLQIPYAEVMQRALAPQQRPEAFLGVYANMPAPAFEQAASRVQTEIVRDTRLVADGRTAELRQWRFPSAEAIKASLQTLVMARIVGNAGQEVPRLAVTASAIVMPSARAVQLRLPVPFGRALVTVSHPSEQWVEKGALSRPFPIP